MDAIAVFAMIGALLLGLLLIAIALVIVIYIYNALYRHFVFAGKRFLAPVIVIGSIYLIGFIVRLSIFCTIGNEAGVVPTSYEQLTASAFSMIYSSISIFSFEGISNINNVGNMWCLATFFSISVWQAISFVLIITFGISYSFSSRVKLYLFAIVTRCRPRIDGIYIATNASNESLSLMKSIEKHNAKKEEGKSWFKKNRYLYIFAGDELGKYERTNEVHRKIRINNYYFVPIEKGRDTTSQKELLIALHLCSKSKFPYYIVGKKIKIFALQNDKNDRGLESANSDTAFDDIERTLTPTFIHNFNFRKKDEPIEGKVATLGYYVLSNSCLNYEFYFNKLKCIINKCVDKYLYNYLRQDHKLVMNYLYNHPENQKDVKKLEEDYLKTKRSKFKLFKKHIKNKWMNKKLSSIYIKKGSGDLLATSIKAKSERIKNYDIVKQLGNIFQMYVLNEANLATDDLIVKKENMVAEQTSYSEKEINHKDEKVHRLLLVGFGQTGQESLDNLFEDFSAVYEDREKNPYCDETIDKNNTVETKNCSDGKDYYAYRFEALIIDKDILKIIGPYINTHPSFLFKEIKNYEVDFDGEENFIHKQKLIDVYKKIDEDYGEGIYKDMDERMPFPRIFYYKGNYNDPASEEVIKAFINRGRSAEEAPLNIFHGAIDSTVIALGDDESNIEAANALLFRLRQVMANKDNASGEFIPSTETDYTTTFDICVNIRDKNSVMRLTWEKDFDSLNNIQVRVIPFGSYDSMYSYDYILEENAARRVNYLYTYTKKKEKLKYDMFHPISEKKKEKELDLIKEASEEKIFNEYFVISSYRKNVNKHAAMFAKKYSRYINKHTDMKNEEYLDYLANLEHVRWVRFHMANGGLFNSSVCDIDSFKKVFKGVSQSPHMTDDEKLNYGKDYYRIHNCLLPYSMRYFVGVGLKYRKNDYTMVRYNDYIINTKKEKVEESDKNDKSRKDA